MTYISYPLETDRTVILQNMYDYIKARSPQWLENDTNLDTWILQSTALQGADLRELATDVTDEIFRYYGQTLLGLPPISASQATVLSTWTMTDTLGHTVVAGTYVGLRDANGIIVPFQVADTFAVPAGLAVTPTDPTTGLGTITLIAVDPGLAGSGLGGAAVAAELITPLSFVSSVVLSGLTTGGVDAESNDDYLARLARRLRRLSTRPVLPVDFANMALDIPGVARAVAIDGYNPANGSTNNERMVAVAAMDENGNNLTTQQKIDLAALFAANREATFAVNIFDPAVSLIAVTTTVKAVVGYDLPSLETDVENALYAYLDPATWGLDAAIAQGVDARWVETTTLSYFEVAQIISEVPGVDRIISLTMNIVGNSPGTADIVLPGRATLASANPGSMVCTAT